MMSSAYSRQSRSTLGDIDRLALDDGAHPRLQGVRSDEVDLATKVVLEERLETHEREERRVLIEVHEDIDVAVLASVAARDGPEQGDATYTERAPDFRQVGAQGRDRFFTTHRQDYRGGT